VEGAQRVFDQVLLIIRSSISAPGGVLQWVHVCFSLLTCVAVCRRCVCVAGCVAACVAGCVARCVAGCVEECVAGCVAGYVAGRVAQGMCWMVDYQLRDSNRWFVTHIVRDSRVLDSHIPAQRQHPS